MSFERGSECGPNSRQSAQLLSNGTEKRKVVLHSRQENPSKGPKSSTVRARSELSRIPCSVSSHLRSNLKQRSRKPGALSYEPSKQASKMTGSLQKLGRDYASIVKGIADRLGEKQQVK
ncbi:unnamed protein product [Protopolystoma xenopodis]|uniref:Uncharacterized protein n=1 Tax=Protopolystoma xenopodis TaxID=117903 RepID=A0A448WCD6_9PLAT|nr:unnamed protein product [Protopolystoma xenopodis]